MPTVADQRRSNRYGTLGELYSTFRQNMSTACDTDPRAAACTPNSVQYCFEWDHLRLMNKRCKCKMSSTIAIAPNVAYDVRVNGPLHVYGELAPFGISLDDE